jgi:CheY-like chemotaxis protein
MTVREQLLEVSGLNLSKKLSTMGDGEFNDYVQVLNSFVAEFPEQEENIKSALGEKDYLSFSKNLAVVKDELVSIHADSLADDCSKQMNEITSVNHEKLEAYVTNFLSVLTMLSIDIQMAILKDKKDTEPAKKTDKQQTGEKHILAVDDSAFILGILRNILNSPRYKLTCVTNANDALKFISNHRPDLFILDIEMPKINGYELAKNIKESGQTGPIIFLTANATKEYLIRAVNAGAVDFIVKPVDKDHVLARIAKHI